jgi:hypothetical protein
MVEKRGFSGVHVGMGHCIRMGIAVLGVYLMSCSKLVFPMVLLPKGVVGIPIVAAADGVIEYGILLARSIGDNCTVSEAELSGLMCSSASAPPVYGIIMAGVNSIVRLVSGETLLHLCVRWNRRECVGGLLWLGADANGRRYDGGTPIHVAAEVGLAPMVELLLASNGAEREESIGCICPACCGRWGFSRCDPRSPFCWG